MIPLIFQKSIKLKITFPTERFGGSGRRGWGSSVRKESVLDFVIVMLSNSTDFAHKVKTLNCVLFKISVFFGLLFENKYEIRLTSHPRKPS